MMILIVMWPRQEGEGKKAGQRNNLFVVCTVYLFLGDELKI